MMKTDKKAVMLEYFSFVIDSQSTREFNLRAISLTEIGLLSKLCSLIHLELRWFFIITGLYHPNRNDKIIIIERSQMFRHAENGGCADFERRFVKQTECFDYALIRQRCFLYLYRAKLAVALNDEVDLFGVAVAVVI